MFPVNYKVAIIDCLGDLGLSKKAEHFGVLYDRELKEWKRLYTANNSNSQNNSNAARLKKDSEAATEKLNSGEVFPLAELLKLVRLEQEMFAKDLVERFRNSGSNISKSTISEYENGKKIPTPEIIEQYKQHFSERADLIDAAYLRATNPSPDLAEVSATQAPTASPEAEYGV
jgi:transcriptional regulator with XRE-family HTH domain